MTTLRNAILAMALLLSALSSNVLASKCATCKGSWKIGGGLYTLILTFSASPSVEALVADGVAVGGEFIYFKDSRGFDSNGMDVSSTGVMPTIAFHLPLGSNRRSRSSGFVFFKFGSGSAKYSYRDINKGFYGADLRSSTSGWFFGGHIGFMPMLSKTVGLELGLHFRNDFPNAISSFTTTQVGAALAIFKL